MRIQTLEQRMEILERQVAALTKLVKAQTYTVREAAKILKVTNNTIYNRLRNHTQFGLRYGIDFESNPKYLILDIEKLKESL